LELLAVLAHALRREALLRGFHIASFIRIPQKHICHLLGLIQTVRWIGHCRRNSSAQTSWTTAQQMWLLSDRARRVLHTHDVRNSETFCFVAAFSLRSNFFSNPDETSPPNCVRKQESQKTFSETLFSSDQRASSLTKQNLPAVVTV
jgi:hypothetical protein